MSGMAVSAHASKPLGCLFRSSSHRPGAITSGCRATLSRSAIPARMAWRVRDLSQNFTIAPDCGTIRPDSWVRRALLAARHFDVLLPTHEQGFLLRGAATAGGSRRVALRTSRAIELRTARPDLAGCSMNWIAAAGHGNVKSARVASRRPFVFPCMSKLRSARQRGIWRAQ